MATPVDWSSVSIHVKNHFKNCIRVVYCNLNGIKIELVICFINRYLSLWKIWNEFMQYFMVCAIHFDFIWKSMQFLMFGIENNKNDSNAMDVFHRKPQRAFASTSLSKCITSCAGFSVTLKRNVLFVTKRLQHHKYKTECNSDLFDVCHCNQIKNRIFSKCFFCRFNLSFEVSFEENCS